MIDTKDQIDRLDNEANWLAEQLAYYCSPNRCMFAENPLGRVCSQENTGYVRVGCSPRAHFICTECWRQRARTAIEYEEEEI